MFWKQVKIMWTVSIVIGRTVQKDWKLINFFRILENQIKGFLKVQLFTAIEKPLHFQTYLIFV